jgi:uncharacterized repeat protein (TIGR03803 family)
MTLGLECFAPTLNLNLFEQETQTEWSHNSHTMWREATMKDEKTISSSNAHFHQWRSFPTGRALMLAMIVLVVVSVTAVATAQTYWDLYNFGSIHPGDPMNPTWAGIIAQGRDGNMYSTAPLGGANNLGAVFKITPAGKLSVLYSFHGTDGQSPQSGLTLATDGNFYGTTSSGGVFGYGTIFRITSKGRVTTLYNFPGGKDGSTPTAPPIQGLDGNLYGTSLGGNGNKGSVWTMTPYGAFTTLHTFDGKHGANPCAPLVQATDGYFYGTTYNGGTSGTGIVFRVSSSGKFTVLFNFADIYSDTPIGANPAAPLIQANDGNLYGVTEYGWDYYGEGYYPGVVFKIAPGNEFTVIYAFSDGFLGGDPIGGLTQATDGYMYGANTAGGGYHDGGGVLYRIDYSGNSAGFYAFPDGGAGSRPQDTMLQHTNGVLYGTTNQGGRLGGGTFYSFNMGLAPFVSFLPAAGNVGKTVEFLGQGFTGTTDVSFNGAAATFMVVSDTYLTAVVPAGATTGFATVTTTGGILTSSKEFRVMP